MAMEGAHKFFQVSGSNICHMHRNFQSFVEAFVEVAPARAEVPRGGQRGSGEVDYPVDDPERADQGALREQSIAFSCR